MNLISDILCRIICVFFDFLVLNNKGAFSSFSNLHDKVVLLEKKKYHFSCEYTCDAERTKYVSVVDKIKELDFFVYKMDNIELKTVVHKKNKIVKQDDVVAITTNVISNNFYITSYEKIAILEETENTMTFCMTTCSENFVNGYYRFKVKYNVDNKQIELKYSKVQSFDTLLSWFLIKINETIYIEDGKTSIMNTINYLLNDTPLNINDVKYDYL
jgi:hypothetical protein